VTERSAVADMLLAGRYRLERPVASGPCTTLWRAVDEVLTRPVAIKVLDRPGAVPGCATAQEAAARFTTSATSVGRLAHPQIASTYDAGVDDGLPYIVTEWVEGVSVAEIVREAPMGAARATSVGAQAAEAIRYAHASGVPHGDVDGFNVLVCPDGAVKLTDFGVAAALAEDRRPAALQSVSPEERDTREIAALLYLCLTGRSVYGTEHELTPAPYAEGRLLSPREVRAGVPRELNAVVMRALEPVTGPGGGPVSTPDELLAEIAGLPGDGDDTPQPTVAFRLDRPRDVAGDREPSRWWRVGLPLVLVLVLAAVAILVGLQVGALQDRDGGSGATGGPGAQLGKQAPAKLRPSTVGDFDPEGNPDTENPDQVARAFDGNPATAWRTERYDSATLGNLKSGVGLVIDLGRSVAVREVRVALLEEGATVQLRAADAPGQIADSYRVVAEAANGTQTVVLTPRRGTQAQYWLLWITRLPRSEGGFRAQVGEVEFYG